MRALREARWREAHGESEAVQAPVPVANVANRPIVANKTVANAPVANEYVANKPVANAAKVANNGGGNGKRWVGWRARNPDLYRERQRDLMRKRRATAKGGDQ